MFHGHGLLADAQRLGQEMVVLVLFLFHFRQDAFLGLEYGQPLHQFIQVIAHLHEIVRCEVFVSFHQPVLYRSIAGNENCQYLAGAQMNKLDMAENVGRKAGRYHDSHVIRQG